MTDDNVNQDSIPTFLGVKVLQPLTGEWSGWMRAAVDVQFPVTRLQAGTVRLFELPLSSHTLPIVHEDGSTESAPLYEATILAGTRELSALVLPVEMGIPCIVGADLIGEATGTDPRPLYDIFVDEFGRALMNAARSKKRTVLIIGPYGEDVQDLEKIRTCLGSIGYRGILLRDFPDIEEQSVTEKMLLFGSLSRFVICLDLRPSGHNVELETCARAGFVTAVLRLEGRPTTSMQNDIVRNHTFIQQFDVKGSDYCSAVGEAVEWAGKKVLELSATYDRENYWRNRNVRLG